MADMTFILDDGDGTVTVEREPSWDTPQNKTNQIAKFLTRDAPALPAGVNPAHYAWDGERVVEADPAVKDAVDAAIAASESAAENEQAPDTGYDNLSREMRWVIRMFIKLADRLGLNESAVKTVMRQEWNATKETP